MASNDFSKEERVAFDQLLAGFEDALVLSKNVSKYDTQDVQMERSSNTIWRPMPYVLQSFDGDDASGNYQGLTQLAVPAQLNIKKHVPWLMTYEELRDSLQENRAYEGAKQRLASDINNSLLTLACNTGTVVVTSTAAASSATAGSTAYDTIADARASFSEIGVNPENNYLCLSPRDLKGAASNLAARQTLQGKTLTAYERTFIDRIAAFDVFSLDYTKRIAACTATPSISGADQYYTPVATRTATTGEQSNVDNRYQQITVDSTTGVAAGGCLTIDAVYSVHLITKEATSQLKTFRVISVDDATHMTISPAIISGGGNTDAELQYQNVSATPADGAAITFINYDAADINPFWHKDALEILPGKYAAPMNAGVNIMMGTTENGISLMMQKGALMDNNKVKYKFDTFYGVVNKQPEMTGIILFSQTP